MNASFFSWLRYCALTIAILASSTPARAAIMRHDVPSSAYEAYFKDPMFQSVGWLAGQSSTDGFKVAGSITAIDDGWWGLTNYHVVVDSLGNPYDQLWLSLSDSIYTEAPNYVAIDAVYAHPEAANHTVPGTGVDLALVHFSTPVTSITAATRFRGEDQRNTLVYAAGYGRPGVANGNLGASDGIGRAGSVIAEQFGSDPPLVLAEPQYWLAEMLRPSDPLAQPLGWQLSPGDSGGGWFADIFGTGTYELVGINSFVKGLGLYGGTSGALRLSLHNDWIDTTIAQNSVPEPSSFLCFSIALCSLGFRASWRRIVCC